MWFCLDEYMVPLAVGYVATSLPPKKPKKPKKHKEPFGFYQRKDTKTCQEKKS